MKLPALRFPEFVDIWSAKKLSEVIDSMDSGWSPLCESYPASENEWGVLKTTSTTWNGFDGNENKKLPSKLKPRPKYEIQENDILITRAGPAERVGVVCHVNKTRSKLILSDKLIRIKTIKSVSSKFLAVLLSSPKAQNHLVSRKSGLASAQTNISQSILLELDLNIPGLEEQTKIAKLFNIVDEKISLLSQKCDLLSQYKKGLMQQIFSQELRFKDTKGQNFSNWKERKLVDLVEKIGSGGTPKSTNPKYYDGDIPWVSITDMTSSGKFISDTKRKITTAGLAESSARVYPEGVVLFAMYASIGEVAIAKIPLTTSQAILSIQTKNELLLNEFLYFWLYSLKDKIVLMGQQGVQSNLNLDIVKNFIIALPSISEQIKITNFLNNIDKKIAAVQSQLTLVKQYKQGLLQQMFI